MLFEVKVNNVFHGDDKNFIQYMDISDNLVKYAGLPDNLDPCVGDIVEIFKDNHLSYQGFRAVVIRMKKG